MDEGVFVLILVDCCDTPFLPSVSLDGGVIIIIVVVIGVAVVVVSCICI